MSDLLLFYNRIDTAPIDWSIFRHLFVLGDSYSANTKNTWVGHLQKRITSQEGPPHVHNFAVAGDTVEFDLSDQLRRLYNRYPSDKSLQPNDRSLFVFWMGINDCGCTAADELEPIVEQMFDAIYALYANWNARSFLLINLPPMERSPGGLSIEIDSERYNKWNVHLLEQAATFAESASQASVFVVSAHRMISDVLDRPEAFGFSKVSGKESFEGNDDGLCNVWDDDIHLSSAVHQVLAERLLRVFDGK